MAGGEDSLTLVACSELTLDSVFEGFLMKEVSPVSIEFGTQVGGFISAPNTCSGPDKSRRNEGDKKKIKLLRRYYQL